MVTTVVCQNGMELIPKKTVTPSLRRMVLEIASDVAISAHVRTA